MRYRFVLFWAFLILQITSVNAQESLSFEVIGTPTYNQDTDSVSVDLVIQGNRNLDLTDLTASDFDIGEASSNVVVDGQRRLPIAMAIIIDLSIGSDDDLIRDTLQSFFTHYYQADDDITLYILDGEDDEPRVVTVDSLEMADDVIGDLTKQDDYYSTDTAWSKALGDLRLKGVSSVRPRVALHIASFASRTADVGTVFGFVNEDIPFHVVQAHRSRQDQGELFLKLGDNGGGFYSDNMKGQFVLSDEDYKPINTLKLLFEKINDMRLVYQLSYTSQSQSLDQVRDVQLKARLNNQYTVETQFTYSRDFDPPQIEFANPADLNVNRVPFRDDNLNIVFTRNTQPITISPSYPDGVQRSIESMRLEVLESGTNSVLQSTLTSDLTPNMEGQYIVLWNLDDFTVPDTVTNLQVRVTAVDELGLTAQTERPAIVSVSNAPPLPTPTPAPTQNPLGDAGDGGDLIIAPPVQSSMTANQPTDTSINLLVFVTVVLVIVSVILLARVWRLSRDTAVTSNVSQAVDRADIVPNNLDDMHTPTEDELLAMDQQESTVLAQLVVTKGYTTEIFPQRVIEIRSKTFLIGRAEDDATNLIINVPYVSPQHCEILVEDGNQFTVRDLGSKNGTFVNDERVKEDDSLPAPLGSEISITKSITMEIWDANIHLETGRFEGDGDTDDDVAQLEEEVEFQPLPGLKYVDDDGYPIGLDYEPI
jgi:hypothetical protein